MHWPLALFNSFYSLNTGSNNMSIQRNFIGLGI